MAIKQKGIISPPGLKEFTFRYKNMKFLLFIVYF